MYRPTSCAANLEALLRLSMSSYPLMKPFMVRIIQRFGGPFPNVRFGVSEEEYEAQTYICKCTHGDTRLH